MTNFPDLKNLVNWFDSVSNTKKIYFLITLIAIGLFSIIKFYDAKITNITNYTNARIDSISIFYTDKLEKCNTENKEEYFKILTLLKESIQEQQKLKAETENLKLQTK